MPILERSNPLPLYYQLKEVLKQQIHSGHLAPHTAIPSEPELVAQYHVSRATVRQALTELVHEGLLYRQHGRGTFVCEPRVQQRVASELKSFSEELRRRGLKPGGMLLVSELVRGSQHVREQLRLNDEEQVVRLERIRTADGEAIAYEVNYLPYPRAMNVYQRAKEAADGSLYQLMASEGMVPYMAEHVFKGDKANEREIDLLKIPADECGMRVECTTFDETGAPISFTEAFYPSSRYEFQLTLRVASK
ncbi:GntR family transcriptional regulator [Thermosporothrix hazakensis]|jgi:GntR family transcriptional regulator|uniref:GntR family transcriptional regulator n=2 Tax=Thermosporothrix TaxID=768650 RepID=A0A326UD92_THEHA|nr:GntR family transcriptional regulator [Thermosporothrix hazakensis]PZW36296.1 GntR family transcriptional regulator [Thermosporothrix hazakensis]BBH88762.1 GntR family transcriptional regulator [Thermosporothrix sp. COM3]GCE46946.1 GntR family transcriptional regulator [Thermosporothrix hazakensis]